MEMATIRAPRLDRLTAQRAQIVESLAEKTAVLSDLQRQIREEDTPALRAAVSRALNERNAVQDRLNLTDADLEVEHVSRRNALAQADRTQLMERCTDVKVSRTQLEKLLKDGADAFLYLHHCLLLIDEQASEVSRRGLQAQNAAHIVAVNDGLDPSDMGLERHSAVVEALAGEGLDYEATLPPTLPGLPKLDWRRGRDAQVLLADLRADLGRWE